VDRLPAHACGEVSAIREVECDSLVEGSVNRASSYETIGRYIAEIYDQVEAGQDDVELIRSLLGDPPSTILEPFCGHGRILLPLAEAGFEVVGLDLSERMLDGLANRLQCLSPGARGRVSFARSDVVADAWPTGFDVVVLGGNCLYELATADEQEQCIRSAALALKKGGHLYLDNDHMEGDLDPAWYAPAEAQSCFPTGTCSDGTVVHGTMETIWHDAPKRLVRFRRTATIRSRDGRVERREWIQQKHPPSTDEMVTWLGVHGFRILEHWGDYYRSRYSPDSGRAILWASRD
jgi:SAM-dependent methyltransferase